jgi:hypothetical protein
MNYLVWKEARGARNNRLTCCSDTNARRLDPSTLKCYVPQETKNSLLDLLETSLIGRDKSSLVYKHCRSPRTLSNDYIIQHGDAVEQKDLYERVKVWNAPVYLLSTVRDSSIHNECHGIVRDRGSFQSDISWKVTDGTRLQKGAAANFAAYRRTSLNRTLTRHFWIRLGFIVIWA